MADATNSSRPRLYTGEILTEITGFPTIYHYSPAVVSTSTSPTKPHDGINPLVVCITGGLHLGRIFYGGHSGYTPQDFLVYWLNRCGYSVLSLSYPLETDPEIMPPSATNFRISDWGQQAAATTRKIIDTHHLLTNTVILISWSMGGRVVVPFTLAARALDVDVQLYISFAATPGFSSIRPLPAGMECTSNGYFWVPAHLDNFCAQLDEMRQISGNREIVSNDVYLKEYTGKSPINLIGLCLKYDRERRQFVRDDISHEGETRVLDIASLPLIAGIVPESALDASHALGDRASWGFLLTYKIENMIGSQRLEKDKWEALKELVRKAPERLFQGAEGNHFFFVGEVGARAAAKTVVKLVELAGILRQELDELKRP